MERNGVMKSVSMMTMLLMIIGGVCAKSRLTQFIECYDANFSICTLQYNNLYCAAKATSVCTRQAQSSQMVESSSSLVGDKVTAKERYCELGCALSRCTNFSTKHDPKGEEVAKCFEFCSDITCKPKTSNAQTSGNDQHKTNTTDDQTIDDFCKLGCEKTVCGETAEKYDALHLCGRSCTVPCS